MYKGKRGDFMGSYWKEVVNFGGEFKAVKLLLTVSAGVGICEFDGVGVIENGNIQLLTREGGVSHDFAGGVASFAFQTSHREYCVRIYCDGVLICGSGNSKNLKHEFALPKIYATDVFENRVADFNYFETELGEKGKSLESLLCESENPAPKSQDNTKERITNVTEEIIKEEIIKEEIIKEEIIKEEIKTEEVAEEIIKEEIKAEEVAEEIVLGSAQNPDLPDKDFEAQNARSAKSETQRSSQSKPQAARKKGGKSKKESDFFSLAKPQVEKMLSKFPKEEFLEEVLDNSKWVKVDFSKGVSYAVGIIYADDLVGYIGYGVKGNFQNPPKFENPQFVPFDIASPAGDGYFLIFQRADTGEKV